MGFVSSVSIVEVDTRETLLDIGGQELMTADRVTLRLNVNVVYRVVDPARAIPATADLHQALYRDVQLASRTAVGQRDLDALLVDRDSLADELARALGEAGTRRRQRHIAGFGRRQRVDRRADQADLEMKPPGVHVTSGGLFLLCGRNT